MKAKLIPVTAAAFVFLMVAAVQLSAHHGTAFMETILGMVRQTESTNAAFAGFAIEDYAGFSVLGP